MAGVSVVLCAGMLHNVTAVRPMLQQSVEDIRAHVKSFSANRVTKAV
jgi:hypothetical protein